MYHPSRGGVRGGRDQFNWEDVKVDKHRENYLGHSIKAPVGRWQRGKDLHWYNKDGSKMSAQEVAKMEIERVKAEEEQAIREALGLAPSRQKVTGGHHLDKHELAELLKKGKTAEELSDTYAEAELVQGLGFAPLSGQRKASGYEKGDQLAGVRPVQVPETSSAAAAGGSEVNGAAENDNAAAKKATKDEKREAKEKRRQERRAAKLARREERRHGKESGGRDGGSRSPSRKRHRRRHDSDSE